MKYKVTIEGKTYEVDVDITEGSNPGVVKNEPASAVNTAPAAASISGNGEKIAAPMPGTIIDVKVSEGQSVKKGEIILILEAMKMENEIVSPIDGTIKQIPVSKGATVNTGDILAVIG